MGCELEGLPALRKRRSLRTVVRAGYGVFDLAPNTIGGAPFRFYRGVEE